ncbi:UDP-glucose 4-epimerase GalE [Paenibacillus sp. P25]|nr:UDP-glucose 4-epimerase GalE [Paenibacillus sp. P25]
MAILVTGGAGYIGSHTVAESLARNEEVVIVDNLQQGHREAVLGGKLYVGDLRDAAFMDTVFKENAIDAVIHFAANSLVGESMQNPGKYYHNNVYGTLCLLEKDERVRREADRVLLYGGHLRRAGAGADSGVRPDAPTNAYGETKLAMEKMMRWFDTAHGIKYVSLRYFNAAGAHESGRIGEDHSPETHLVPLVLQVALGKRAHISVFGDDYATPDGTCIRDYIHVTDLADAHILAIEKLRAGGESGIYNLGNGKGFSVKEVIEIARKVTGHAIPAVIEARRAGDPAVLIASSERSRTELGWKPRRDSLEEIIATAWAWHKSRPNGYGSN